MRILVDEENFEWEDVGILLNSVAYITIHLISTRDTIRLFQPLPRIYIREEINVVLKLNLRKMATRSEVCDMAIIKHGEIHILI